MPFDNRPVALIPAYKPEAAVVEIAGSLIDSKQFQGIVCVNDGSGPDYEHLFESLKKLGATILPHYVNLGKGMALRTGLNYIACCYPHASGVVTLDADGQHLSKDILAVGKTLQEHPLMLIMGCRMFGQDVPLRSRFGNLVTRTVVKFFCGIKVSDTQTGLRGIPGQLITPLLRLTASGYDFEMNMLVKARELGIQIKEVPISTVYIDNNLSSHFRPLRDSLAIYFVLLRHSANALVTAVLDYITFACMLALGYSIIIAMIAGRIFAGFFNFYVGRKLVFKSKENVWRQLIGYIALVAALMLISYSSIIIVVTKTNLSPYAAKIIVELAVFFLSFSVQKVFIFTPNLPRSTETDWDTYYQNRTSSSSPTRKITERMLISEISRHCKVPPQTITELGGGDSCFCATFKQRYPDAYYLVIDKSSQGIEKFLRQYQSTNCHAVQADLLTDLVMTKAELVYSVGLIEHFDAAGTAQVIKSHFDAALPGGIIIMTYPTPTLLYRLIRWAAALLGIWRFPDERPLMHDEVRAEINKYGTILASRMNWYIGLTQEIIVGRKAS